MHKNSIYIYIIYCICNCKILQHIVYCRPVPLWHANDVIAPQMARSLCHPNISPPFLALLKPFFRKGPPCIADEPGIVQASTMPSVGMFDLFQLCKGK